MQNPTTIHSDRIVLRKPRSEDGAAVWELIKACEPLDQNSVYCNLVQCDQFRDTCVIALRDDEVIGWISGHIVPNEPGTLFIWQVAVSEKARGEGLASRMLKEILRRDVCAKVDTLKTTITRDNEGSWALFTRFAEKQGGELDSEAHFKSDDHFDGMHDTEHMVTISFAEAKKSAA